MSRKISDALLKNATKLVLSGATFKDAAAAIGCSADELSKKLRVQGVRSPRRDWNAAADQILTMYKAGHGTTAIAAHLGASRHSASNVRDVLIRNGADVRSRGQATSVRMSKLDPVQRNSLVAPARSKRMRNMVLAAASGARHAAFGFGEEEVFKLLSGAGFPAIRQVVVDNNYLIDIAVGNLAVEIKTRSAEAHITKLKADRFEKLRESGYALVFVVVNHIPTLRRHANDLIAAIDAAHRNPPTGREYWVIRCSLEQIGTHTEVDHWSVERRSPNSARKFR